MAELIAGIAELVAGVLQIVGEVLVAMLAAIFRAMFSKPTVDEDGNPVAAAMERPSNRWEIFGYSMLGSLIIALAIGGTCFYIWGTARSFLVGSGIVLFLGIFGALGAATD